MDSTIPDRYCSTIQLELIVEGQTIELSKVQSDLIYLCKATCLPPCDAKIVMYVDSEPRVWPVHLPYGAVSFDNEVEIVIR